MKNKHGLDRNIPAKTKEIIRKRDGFGCVHCGRGVYTYEHFNPTYKEAETHNVDGIALLCGQCQILTTKGILSKETIQADVYNPYCKRVGFSNDFFDLKFPLLIYFGNFEYYASKDKLFHEILIINNEVTLGCSVDPIGGPLQLSAIFRNKENEITLEIVNNEWKANSENWDIVQTARKLTIFNSEKIIGIEIEILPPHKICFNKFITHFNNSVLTLEKTKMIITNPSGESINISTDYLIRRSAPIRINL